MIPPLHLSRKYFYVEHIKWKGEVDVYAIKHAFCVEVPDITTQRKRIKQTGYLDRYKIYLF